MNTQREGVPEGYKGQKSGGCSGEHEDRSLTGESTTSPPSGVLGCTGNQQKSVDTDFTILQGYSDVQAGETSDLVARITDTSQALTSKVHVASNSAVRTAVATKNGIDTIERVMKCMREITGAMNDVVESVEKLGWHSRDIDSVAVAVSDIAKRTNTVTKGVVKKSGKASNQEQNAAPVLKDMKKVAKLINEEAQIATDCIRILRTDISECIKTAGIAAKRVEEGYRTANEAGVAMDRVMDSVEDVSGQLDYIFEAAEQVNDYSTDMRNIINNVVREVKDSSEKLAKMSSELHDHIALFQPGEKIADLEGTEQWTLQGM